MRRSWILIAFCLLLPAFAHAAGYSQITPYDGHWAAADSCIVEFAPEASVDGVEADLVKTGFGLASIGLPDGVVVLRADLDDYKGFVGADVFMGVVALNPALDLAGQLAAVARIPGVKAVWPNYIHFALWVPNDPYYGGYQDNFKQIYMEKAWNLASGQGATVAVIDTGYRTSGMSDSARNLLAGYDFWGNDSNVNDYIGHGTHVSNVIAERTNNGVGCAGIAYDARILPLKVFPDYDGGAQESDIISAINYATSNGADVINMSLGGGGYVGTTNSAINNAFSHEVVVVAASGNSGTSSVEYPGAYENCIAVGATYQHAVGANPSRASFSNYGSALDLVAPGVGIVQETFGTSGTGYYQADGTSSASPHVAAVAALLVDYGGADASRIRNAMEDTARSSGGTWTNTLGWGEVDAYGALVAYGGQENQGPTARADATPSQGAAPLDVAFSGAGSTDPDGSIASYIWRLKSNNQVIGSGKNVDYTFDDPGSYSVVLTVTDNEGATDTDQVNIYVTSSDDDSDDDDDNGFEFDDSECGVMLDAFYNVCDLELIFNSGDAVNPGVAFEMCDENDPAETWDCLLECYDMVHGCDGLENCATSRCGVQLYTGGFGGDDDDDSGDFMWGCGG